MTMARGARRRAECENLQQVNDRQDAPPQAGQYLDTELWLLELQLSHAKLLVRVLSHVGDKAAESIQENHIPRPPFRPLRLSDAQKQACLMAMSDKITPLLNQAIEDLRAAAERYQQYTVMWAENKKG